MADHVSVTSHHSYGSRVKNSFSNIFRGFVLVIGSIVLLVWNENNYVKQKAALDEGASIVQEASATQIDSSLEGKEIHISGETASDADALQDSTFGIVTDDLKLKRTVEMYQRYEESNEECHDNYGGSEDCTTTYDYYKRWDDQAIDSSKFYSSNGHENPSSWAYNSDERVKQPITLGNYKLTNVFVDKLTDYKAVNLSEQNVNTPEQYKLTVEQTSTSDGSVEDNNNSYLYGDSQPTTSSSKFHVNDNYIYIGANPASPAVGDLKISFSSVKPGTVSIVGKQMGNELASYTVSNGRTITLLEQGNVSAEDMFLHAQQANKQMTWILRFLGLFLMYCGFAMMFKFIETIAKVLPFLANIIGVGTGIIALCLTIVVGFLTIGIAWVAVRPVVGICCLVVAAGGIFLLIKSKKTKKFENIRGEASKTEAPENIEEPKQ